MHLDDLVDALLVGFEGDDAGDLDRLEGAVVQVGLDAGQRGHHSRIAADEAQAPAGHVVRLRGREDLDADLARARHLEERGRLVAIEGEVGVGEVVHDHQTMLAREVDDFHEEVPVDAHRRRVVRKGEDQQLGLRPRQSRRLLEPREEIAVGRQRNRPEIAVGDDDRVRMDRIGRVRHERAVARLEHGQGQMRHAFLGADRRDHLGVRIEIDLVAVAIPLGHRDAQPRDAARGRVPVILRVLRGLDELVDDVLRRGHVWIAHAEIDHVLAASSSLGLEVVDDRKDVRWKALDSIELVHGGLLFEVAHR